MCLCGCVCLLQLKSVLYLSKAHEVWSSSCATIGMGLFVLFSLSLSLTLVIAKHRAYEEQVALRANVYKPGVTV